MTTLTRKPAAERRDEIARAILGIIGERGAAGVTTTTIAAEVGVTTGALFRHYATRDAMLEGAVQYALGKIDNTFPDQLLAPLERIVQLAKQRVRLLGDDRGLAWLLRSEQPELTLPETAVEQLRARVRRSKKFLLDALREGVSDGSIRDDFEPEVLLVLVMGTIHASIGMPGVHRVGSVGKTPNVERILIALKTVLAHPDGHRQRQSES